MTTSVQLARQLVEAGSYAAAHDRLAVAADRNDADALLELARWRIAGNLIRRDLQRARDLARRSSVAGHAEAGLLHASWLASGVGGECRWRDALQLLDQLASSTPRARQQLQLLAAMAIDNDGEPIGDIAREVICHAPHIVRCDTLFTTAECAYLRDAASALFQRSVVADPATGRMVPHPVRRSDAAMFGVFAEDVVVSALNRRIAAFSGTDYAQAEPLQVLRYAVADEYRKHLDVLPNESNQRVATVLVYLNDSFVGGETVFDRAAVRIDPRAGSAIMFRNVDDQGRAEPMAEHAGRPVTSGTKYVASRWIRRTTFTYPPPRPLLEV